MLNSGLFSSWKERAVLVAIDGFTRDRRKRVIDVLRGFVSLGAVDNLDSGIRIRSDTPKKKNLYIHR